MLLSEILETLPNGFHDAKLLSLKIDWLENQLVLDMSVWVDEKVNKSGAFDDLRRFGRLRLTGLKAFASDGNFNKFDLGDGAWIDVGCDFDKVKTPADFVISKNSGWIYFNEYNGFIFFSAKDADFSWIEVNM